MLYFKSRRNCYDYRDFFFFLHLLGHYIFVLALQAIPLNIFTTAVGCQCN